MSTRRALHPRLFDAYWGRARDIGEEQVLIEEGAAVGLPEAEVAPRAPPAQWRLALTVFGLHPVPVPWVMIRQAGPRWDHSRALREQDAWTEHASFIDGLEEQGSLLLAGPPGVGGFHRVILILDCESEAAAHELMARDPWSEDGHLVTASVEPWTVLIGAARLSRPGPPQAGGSPAP